MHTHTPLSSTTATATTRFVRARIGLSAVRVCLGLSWRDKLACLIIRQRFATGPQCLVPRASCQALAKVYAIAQDSLTRTRAKTARTSAIPIASSSAHTPNIHSHVVCASVRSLFVQYSLNQKSTHTQKMCVQNIISVVVLLICAGVCVCWFSDC